MRKKLARVISCILTVAMLCSSMLTVAFAEDVKKIIMTSPDGEINVGDTVRIPVVISDANNLMGIMFKIKWNPEYLSVDTTKDENEEYACYEAPSGKNNLLWKLLDLNINDAEKGEFILGGAGKEFSAEALNSSLGTFIFTVLPGAKGKDVTIEVVPGEDTYGTLLSGESLFLKDAVNASFKVAGDAEPTKYTVTFNDGTTDVKTVQIEENTAIGAENMPADPTKEGYTFDGWFDGETKITAETVVTGNITATAKFTLIPATKYTVTFNDGTTDVKTVQIEENTAIGAANMPADPTKEGYTFDGWFDGETKITAETVVTGNITATAKFTENPVTEEKKIIMTSPDGEINVGDTVRIPVVISDANNLMGIMFKIKWNPEYLSVDTTKDENEEYACYEAPSGKNNLLWKLLDLNINDAEKGEFILGGAGKEFSAEALNSSLGTFIFTVLPGAKGKDVTIEVVPGEDTYGTLLSGESLFLKDAVNASFKVEGTAVTQYTVKFNDGTTDVKTVQIDENTAIGAENMPADPTKEGYTFDGWFDGETKITAETVVTGNIAATAKFTLIPPTQYAVTFKDGETTVDTVMVNKGETVTAEKMPKVPEKTGYTFKGWFIGEDEFTGDTVVNDNITVTAVYEINKYTVTFKDGENELGKADVDYNTAIGAANMPADPTKEGYTFDGWYDGETKITAETVVTGNITATAKFDVNSYQVTFDIDGTTEKVVTINYGDKIGDEMPADPVKEGYVFKGWFNGEEEITKDTEVKGSFTATAKFEEKVPENFTVTFVSDGKTVYTADILEGTTIGDANIPNDRVKDGYTFKGWFNGDDEVKADTTVTGGITVEAKFEVTPAEEIFSLGDADGSGEINGADIVLFRQKLLRRPVMVFDSSKDLYKDGEFDGNDVIRLAQYYAGLLDDSNIQITPAP